MPECLIIISKSTQYLLHSFLFFLKIKRVQVKNIEDTNESISSLSILFLSLMLLVQQQELRYLALVWYYAISGKSRRGAIVD